MFGFCLQNAAVAQYRHQTVAERTFRIIGRIGQSLNLAIERVATVCETLVDDSPHFKKEMFDHCKEMRSEGMCILYISSTLFVYLAIMNDFISCDLGTTAASLESLCELMANNTLDIYDTLEDRTTIIQVGRDLATAVTRSVGIVDAIVCDHFQAAKSKVSPHPYALH